MKPSRGWARMAGLVALGWAHVAGAVEVSEALGGPVVISELVAVNPRGARDEDGETSDGIEVWNRGATVVDLKGWG